MSSLWICWPATLDCGLALTWFSHIPKREKPASTGLRWWRHSSCGGSWPVCLRWKEVVYSSDIRHHHHVLLDSMLCNSGIFLHESNHCRNTEAVSTTSASIKASLIQLKQTGSRGARGHEAETVRSWLGALKKINTSYGIKKAFRQTVERLRPELRTVLTRHFWKQPGLAEEEEEMRADVSWWRNGLGACGWMCWGGGGNPCSPN